MEVPSQLVKSEVQATAGNDDKEVFNKTGKGNNRYYFIKSSFVNKAPTYIFEAI